MKLDQDTLDKLASGEYSISPRSGRLRKRVRIKKKKSFLERINLKRLVNTSLWIVLIAAFVLSLVLVFPELNLVSNKKKTQGKSISK